MADDQTTLAPGLWREGIDCFTRQWKPWLRIGVIFFCIIVVVNAMSLPYLEPLQSQLQAIKSQKDSQAAQQAFLKEHWQSFAPYFLALIATVYAQQYLFFSFFITREMPSETKKASVREFFCFLSKLIQVVFVLTVPGFVAGVLAVIADVVLKKLNVPAGGFLSGLMICAVFVAFIYVAVRFYLVMPLAAGSMKEPIKNSWRLTQNNFWRLFGNMLLLVLLVVAITLFFTVAAMGLNLVLHMAGVFTSDNADQTKWLQMALRYIITGAGQIITAGVSAAYLSAVCRVLYQEKRQSDPSFVLESRI